MSRLVYPSASTVLGRARLTPTGLAAATPQQMARAIRAEFWFGTLAGARVQARLAGSNLATRTDAWRWPALLYLACGVDEVIAHCARASGEIAAAATDATAQITNTLHANPPLAAALLLEFVDVFGPIAAVAPTHARIQAATRVRDLTSNLAAHGDERVENAVAVTCERIEVWLALARGAPVRIDDVGCYDLAETPIDWMEQPRLELLMARELVTAAIGDGRDHRFNSLPSAIHGRSWLVAT